jgi:hypothetical protein
VLHWVFPGRRAGAPVPPARHDQRLASRRDAGRNLATARFCLAPGPARRVAGRRPRASSSASTRRPGRATAALRRIPSVPSTRRCADDAVFRRSAAPSSQYREAPGRQRPQRNRPDSQNSGNPVGAHRPSANARSQAISETRRTDAASGGIESGSSWDSRRIVCERTNPTAGRTATAAVSPGRRVRRRARIR